MKIHEQITEETWCKGTLARDKHNDAVHLYSFNSYNIRIINNEAIKFCLLGWICKVYPETSLRVLDRVQSKLRLKNSIEEWNDDQQRMFQEVKALVTKLDI